MLFRSLAGILLATVGMIQTAAAETVVERVDSQSASFRVVQLLSNLDHPWSMAWLPDGEALIGLRPGGLLRWRPGEARARSVAGLPTVADYGQGGLFDVKPTPDFAKTGQIVMSYAYAGNGGAATRIASATLAGGRITSVNVCLRPLLDPEAQCISAAGCGSGPMARFTRPLATVERGSGPRTRLILRVQSTEFRRAASLNCSVPVTGTRKD